MSYNIGIIRTILGNFLCKTPYSKDDFLTFLDFIGELDDIAEENIRVLTKHRDEFDSIQNFSLDITQKRIKELQTLKDEIARFLKDSVGGSVLELRNLVVTERYNEEELENDLKKLSNFLIDKLKEKDKNLM